jgi:hypothetical protein
MKDFEDLCKTWEARYRKQKPERLKLRNSKYIVCGSLPLVSISVLKKEHPIFLMPTCAYLLRLNNVGLVIIKLSTVTQRHEINSQ